MKTNKMKTAALLALGLVVGIGATVGGYAILSKNGGWRSYVETNLMPFVTVALSSVTAIWVLIKPTVSEILSAASKFKDAARDVRETAVSGKSTEEKNATYAEILNKLKADLEETRAQLNARNAEIIKILLTAFCNEDELVRKGYASEIAKIGEQFSEKSEDMSDGKSVGSGGTEQSESSSETVPKAGSDGRALTDER